MHDTRMITEGRLRRFVDERLTPAIYPRTAPLTVSAWPVPDEPVPARQAIAQEYLPFSVGEPWGRPWSTLWLHVTGDVPANWTAPNGRTGLEILIDLGFDGTTPGFQAEGTAYRPDGTIIKAVSPFNRHVPLAAAGGDRVDLYVEAAANPNTDKDFTFAPTPLGDKGTAGDAPLYRLTQVDLAQRDLVAWELYQDVWTLRGLMGELPEDLPRRSEILRALERMLDAVDPDDVAGTAALGRAELADVLSRPAYASAHAVIATGHAHIDSAWLWPVRETIRKCARTFSNVVALMDDDSDLVFACSSAQQLAWVKEFYPELFGRIRKKVAAGQFVPVGGMWVEADTNLPGGEALVRQFVEGKTFFAEEFGIDCQEVWLPDSFGYSGALPQIAVDAGARWFLGQKMAWNQTNPMPHHTFWWEGIDGSRIFTHAPPVDTYNSDLSGAQLAHAQRNYREKGHGTISLVPFGWGDGGGGPTREMLAAAHRLRSLEGSPTVRMGAPSTFFERAQAELTDPAVWVGEMYLEFHRGTYTSQANTKRGNRRSEHLLREAELWAATATVRRGVPYPYDRLRRSWQNVLLLQFHDILPGSSIAWVYQDAERDYARIAAELESIIADAVAALVGPGDRPLLLNAAPHPRLGVEPLAAGPVTEPAGRVDVSPSGGGFVLDNGVIRAQVDRRGLLVSLVDHASGRDAIAPGAAGNLPELHRDLPNRWDAWDIDEHHRRNVVELDEAADVRLETPGPAATVVVERRFGRSSMLQRISLDPESPSLRITTTVDWHEQEKLLKLGFPLDVRADRSAAETQFGHVFRPTHENTSWDAARFEVCAHRWLHVGEPGYGVAIGNDSTYGHDVSRAVRPDRGTTTTVRLSLLRGPRYPDPATDQGEHTMVVTVRPGASIADAVQEGYGVNLRPRIVPGADPVAPLVRTRGDGVVVESVKLAHDRSGDVVVRLYESLGRRAQVVVEPGFDVRDVHLTDLLERATGSADDAMLRAGAVRLTLRPFQIVTLRLVAPVARTPPHGRGRRLS
ncbi:alpha-mannosidase [Jiangella aurantiaca]|uniref:Alpha-mannosidase n=1 Tax=Jiangella aurantiaca TaxID=2530373 RepID=A0A4R5AJQ0_9ACTN|nr:glycoside hydrolase family 38 C-terminal domain-containing protein [Jiangella aurantiaca]TDD71649.1 alpha-mannosidase [Jiangella aurantiaca]